MRLWLTRLEEAEESATDAELDGMEPEIREFFHKRTARELIAAREFLAAESENFHSNDAALFATGMPSLTSCTGTGRTGRAVEAFPQHHSHPAEGP